MMFEILRETFLIIFFFSSLHAGENGGMETLAGKSERLREEFEGLEDEREKSVSRLLRDKPNPELATCVFLFNPPNSKMSNVV